MELFIVNVVLILTLVSLFLRFGRQPTQLYCGIFGFSGREGKRVDPGKLLVLGLYNRTRGIDSCGYYYNGNIVKGVDKEADFKDFIIKHKFTAGGLPFETIMAHTRKSTYGTHTLENAHPHQVGNYVQTHNGTIKNIWSLCAQNGIDHTNIHVDSLGLAYIIQKTGSYDILAKYEGYAALTMVWTDDPGSLYLYHGASREKKDETMREERPLFTLRASEGLYYSSMEESLTIINKSKTVKPEQLSHNEVYLIQKGIIIKSVYKVNRVSTVSLHNKENNYDPGYSVNRPFEKTEKTK